MKKQTLLAVIASLAVALLALVWFVSGVFRSAAGEAQPAAPAVASEAPAAKSDANALEKPAEPSGLELADNASKEPERATAEIQGDASEDWDVTQAIWIDGVVQAPANCNDPGPIEIYATANGIALEELARQLGREGEKPKRGSKNGSFLARRVVAADGTFRIPIPSDMKHGYISVLGDYLYMPRSQTVEVADGQRTVTLKPECGACIAGTIVVPPSFAGRIGELDGLEVELRSSTRNFSGSVADMGRLRRKTLAHDASFEFRALPVQSNVTLSSEPKPLAAPSVTIAKLVAGERNDVRLTLLTGARVTGSVRDESGAPIADAKVEAQTAGAWFGFDNRTVREAKTSTDGTFTLEAVEPGKVLFVASAKQFLENEPHKLELVDGGSVNDLALVLTSGSSITGNLSWEDGKPAQAIEIALTFDLSQLVGMAAFNARRGAEGSAKTDEQGNFVIKGLGVGPFTLKAESLPPGTEITDKDARDKALCRARADGVQPNTKNVALVLRAPMGIDGLCVDANDAPVAKFKIEGSRVGQGMLGNLGQETRKESYDDAQGHFFFGGLNEGTWRLYVIAEGFSTSEAIDVVVPRAATEPPLRVVLVRAATVAGIVRDPAGNTIADAKIEVDSGEPNWKAQLSNAPKPPQTTSARDGTFVLEGLHPGKAAVLASAKDFAKSVPQSLDLAAGQHVDGIVLVLRVGGLLTGEVFEESGEPAEGRLVQVTEPKIFNQKMTFSDAKGKFQVEHLEPGTWQVVAMPTAQATKSAGAAESDDDVNGMTTMMTKMKTAMIDMKDGEETHIVLGAPPEDPVKVHGHVTHAGAPYPGALLSFFLEGKDLLKSMKTTQVAKDGSYAITLDKPGSYQVSVQNFSSKMMQQSVVEFTNEIPKEKDFKLDLAMPNARISGQVRDAHGDPIQGTRVSLHPQGAIEGGTMWGGQYNESATDGEGRFDIQTLRPGTYTLAVGGSLGGMFGEGQGAWGRELRGDLKLSDGEWMHDVDFKLERSGSIEVSVVDDRGAPVAEAAVFARNKDGRLLDRFSMITTDANGKCKYAGLSAGEYTLSARTAGVTSAESARIKVVEAEQSQARLSLQAGTILIVTTVDGDNKPVKAAVSVQDEEGREVGSMIGLAEIMKLFSSGTGVSSYESRSGPLPPGKYKVKSTGPDGKSSTKPVSLSGQAERKLVMHL